MLVRRPLLDAEQVLVQRVVGRDFGGEKRGYGHDGEPREPGQSQRLPQEAKKERGRFGGGGSRSSGGVDRDVAHWIRTFGLSQP